MILRLQIIISHKEKSHPRKEKVSCIYSHSNEYTFSKFCLANYPTFINCIHSISQEEDVVYHSGQSTRQVRGGYCYNKNMQVLRMPLLMPKCFGSITHASNLSIEVGQFYYPILRERILRHIIIDLSSAVV